MAGRFFLSKVSNEQQSVISGNLHFIEIKKKPQNYYQRQKQQYRSKKSINTYLIKEDYLYLPFSYVRDIIGIKPNQKKEHYISTLIFTGTLRLNQIEPCKEAIDVLKKTGTVILNMYPGFGKTITSAYIGLYFGYKILVVLAGDLIDSWLGTFSKVSKAKVWIVKAKKAPPKEFDVIICMIGRLHYVPLDILECMGTLIIDECHQFCTQKRLELILQIRPRYIMGLSATYERSNDSFHRAMNMICGPKKIIRTYEEPFTIYRYGTGIKADLSKMKKDDGSNDWAQLKTFIAHNEERNKLISNLVGIFVNLGFKPLILTWLNKEHVHLLLDILKTKVDTLDYLSGTKKKYKDSQVLIGTISKIGTGFDEKERCENFGGKRLNVLFIVGSLRSIELLEQICGRVFRSENPIIVHLVDNDGVSTSQWGTCRKEYYLTKRNAKIFNVRKLTRENIIKNHPEHRLDSWDQTATKKIPIKRRRIIRRVIRKT